MSSARPLTRRTLGIFAATLLLAACEPEPRSQRSASPARPRGPRTVSPANRPVLHAEEVLEATSPSIVIIESLDRKRNVAAQGSGVIVAERTVVTAWPLIGRAFAIRVRHRGASHPGSVAAVLERHGLARVSAEVTGPLELGRDLPPGPGATVYSLGAAQGVEITMAEGIATGVREGEAGGIDRIETTASSPAGFTGGGLVDSRGALVGILSFSRAGDPLSRAVPVRYVKDLLALPEGSLPPVTSSPLLRLPAADRQWLIEFMSGVARGRRALSGLGLDRVNALLDRLDPLVGGELEWARQQLGIGLLIHQRLFWEDAVEARAFGRAVKSRRRTEAEKGLLARGIAGPLDLVEWDRTMRAIAAREPFDVPGARVEATERFLAQMITQTDQTRRRIESQLWEARSR